jgi:hypothetical protein
MLEICWWMQSMKLWILFMQIDVNRLMMTLVEMLFEKLENILRFPLDFLSAMFWCSGVPLSNQVSQSSESLLATKYLISLSQPLIIKPPSFKPATTNSLVIQQRSNRLEFSFVHTAALKTSLKRSETIKKKRPSLKVEKFHEDEVCFSVRSSIFVGCFLC